MKDKQVPIAIEKLVAMFIIAMGKPIGVGFTYFPKFPSCFSKNINFAYGCNADFLALRVNSKLGVECWFKSKTEETFSCTLSEIKKMKPYLWVAIITHVCDMIENIEL